MKKLLIVIVSVVFINFLSGCNLFNNKDKDFNIEATVVNEQISEDIVTIDVLVNEDNIETNALNEVANKVANEVYVKHFERLKNQDKELVVNVYKNQEDYNNQVITYGSLRFYINLSDENPGLSIKSNELKNLINR